jgi:hypothetical protein
MTHFTNQIKQAGAGHGLMKLLEKTLLVRPFFNHIPFAGEAANICLRAGGTATCIEMTDLAGNPNAVFSFSLFLTGTERNRIDGHIQQRHVRFLRGSN